MTEPLGRAPAALRLVLMLVSTLVACGAQTSSGSAPPGSADRPVATEATTAERAPRVYSTDDRDAQLEEAREFARNTIDAFIARISDPPPTQTRIALKVGLRRTDGGVEHIWLSHLVTDGNEFRGRLANDPVNMPDWSKGDLVVVGLDDVSDWMAVDDGRLIGGWTIRVIRSRMSPAEREAFDRRSGFKVE